MNVVKDMQELAQSLYRDAREFRSTNPEISDKLELEAEDIYRQFGSPNPFITAPSKEVVVLPPEADTDLDDLLRTMRRVVDQQEAPIIEERPTLLKRLLREV